MDSASAPITPAPSPAAHEKKSKTIIEYLMAKDQQWKTLSQRKSPLTLLELPVDILRLIVKEVAFFVPTRLEVMLTRFRLRIQTT